MDINKQILEFSKSFYTEEPNVQLQNIISSDNLNENTTIDILLERYIRVANFLFVTEDMEWGNIIDTVKEVKDKIFNLICNKATGVINLDVYTSVKTPILNIKELSEMIPLSEIVRFYYSWFAYIDLDLQIRMKIKGELNDEDIFYKKGMELIDFIINQTSYTDLYVIKRFALAKAYLLFNIHKNSKLRLKLDKEIKVENKMYNKENSNSFIN